MIDLTSTRTQIDEQSRRCSRLLAAVIASAVTDAARPPSKTELCSGQNQDPIALAALHFLFADGTAFRLYATLLGADAACMRRALLETPLDKLSDATGSKRQICSQRYTRTDARALRWRMRADMPRPLSAIMEWVMENEVEEPRAD